MCEQLPGGAEQVLLVDVVELRGGVGVGGE